MQKFIHICKYICILYMQKFIYLARKKEERKKKKNLYMRNVCMYI